MCICGKIEKKERERERETNAGRQAHTYTPGGKGRKGTEDKWGLREYALVSPMEKKTKTYEIVLPCFHHLHLHSETNTKDKPTAGRRPNSSHVIERLKDNTDC